MTAKHPTPEERDEKVALPLDPETALRALLQVNPDDEGTGNEQESPPEESSEGQPSC